MPGVLAPTLDALIQSKPLMSSGDYGAIARIAVAEILEIFSKVITAPDQAFRTYESSAQHAVTRADVALALEPLIGQPVIASIMRDDDYLRFIGVRGARDHMVATVDFMCRAAYAGD